MSASEYYTKSPLERNLEPISYTDNFLSGFHVTVRVSEWPLTKSKKASEAG